MQSVTDYLMADSSDVRLRITSVEYDQENDEHRVLFSRSPGGKLPQLTDSDLTAKKDHIPLMADNDSVVIVETRVAYNPGFDVGIPLQSFDYFVVTRPRYYRGSAWTRIPAPTSCDLAAGRIGHRGLPPGGFGV